MIHTLEAVSHYPPTPPPPAPKIHVNVKYAVMTRQKTALVFEGMYSGAPYTIVTGIPVTGINEIYQFIDPLSAIWMGLVTPEDLGLTQNTIAVLKLAMDDLLP